MKHPPGLLLMGILPLVFCWSALAEESRPEGNVFHLKRMVESSQPWKYQIHQNNIDLDPERSYRVTFVAKASEPLQLSVSTKICEPPWSGFGLREKVDLTTEWQTFEYVFEAQGTVPGRSRLTFYSADSAPGEFWIDSVVVRPADAEADSTENRILNPGFDEELTDWRVEGARDGECVFEVQSLENAVPTP